MSKSFRTCDLDQPFLLPPSLQDWLPENHLARFIAELTNGLDLSKIYGFYGRRDGRGKAAYHPAMMARVLLYGYCVGVMSSRRMERASYEDVAFRYLSADQHPDHDTIAAFRQRHLPVLAQLFTQVLQLCNKAGLVKLGHVAIDGTKLQANASKHKAMSYERMEEKEKRPRAEVEKLLGQAAETDAAEDALYGKGKRGGELPAELARRESRLKKIARALRTHRPLLLNYFGARKEFSSGMVQGLNNKAEVSMRRSHGFRAFRILERALYHSLGRLPEPKLTHKFFRRGFFLAGGFSWSPA